MRRFLTAARAPWGFAALHPHIPLVLLIVSACAIVAISANGMRLILPPLDLPGPWGWGVRGLGAAAAVAGMAVLLSRRSQLRKGDVGNSDVIPGSLNRAATIMGLLAVMALMIHPPAGPEDAHGRQTLSPGASSSPGSEPGASSGPPSGMAGFGGGARGSGGGGGGGGFGGSTPGIGGAPESPTVLQQVAGNLPLALLLVVGAVCAFFLLRRQRRPPDAYQSGLPLAPEVAEASLEASLAEMARDGATSRDQITAAYHRLLGALAEAGTPRQVQEAPHEHLHRALESLGIRPGPLHKLTGLYVMVQFSERPVTDRHRASAIQALEVSLAGLRQAQPSPETAGARRVPAEAPG